MSRKNNHEPKPNGVSPREARDIENRARLRARVIYEIVRVEGEEEMKRPAMSLLWSGLAAGLSISFSLLAMAILRHHLPDAGWRLLVVSFGYPIGFLMVVLSRQQLFTETTITVVLPLLARLTAKNLLLTVRMWAIVLCANVLGTAFAAIFCSHFPVIAPALRAEMVEISQQALSFGWFEMLFRAISAGFLMAAMVWLIPAAKGAEVPIVIAMTYLIAAGEFSHIIAGSMEGFMLLFADHWSLLEMTWNFALPALVGNVIGGTALFALISYAQVMEEI